MIIIELIIIKIGSEKFAEMHTNIDIKSYCTLVLVELI